MTQPLKDRTKPLGLVWVDCPQSVNAVGLKQALKEQGHVHDGSEPPPGLPSCVIFCTDSQDDLSGSIKRYQELIPNAALPILVFTPHLDMPLARDALLAGASGFIHAAMTPNQLARAVTVAEKGELVAPRELLAYLLSQNATTNLDVLSVRQKEVLELVAEGLSNAEIGRRLFLSESTIKQHLRAAYKLLKVNNRTEAANLIRRDG
jgi:DNA-binding NarL/FixJ family response regulator